MKKELVTNLKTCYNIPMQDTSQFPLVNGQPVIIDGISGQWAFVSFSDGTEQEVRLSQVDFNREDRAEESAK